MHTILIKYRPNKPVATICSCFTGNNAAADMLAVFGTHYDTNVEGFGAEMNIRQFISKAQSFPNLVNAIITAIKSGESKMEKVDEVTTKFILENGSMMYHSGLRFVVDEKFVKAPISNPTVTVDGQSFASIKAAIESVGDNAVITLVTDTVESGIPVKEGQVVTVDLAGHALMFEAPMTGSAGTKTLGMQLLKGADVTIKNGTIISTEAKMLVQNYSNLTLDNVKLIGSPNNQYVLSNNFGKTTLKNNTVIKAVDGTVAFDAYYGMFEVYDEGVTVEIEDDSVVIAGKIEFGKAKRASEENFIDKAHIIIPAGYSLEAPEGFEWVGREDGKQELAKIESAEVE